MLEAAPGLETSSVTSGAEPCAMECRSFLSLLVRLSSGKLLNRSEAWSSHPLSFRDERDNIPEHTDHLRYSGERNFFFFFFGDRVSLFT